MSDKSAMVSGMSVRFARSATKHRISKESIRYVITHCGLCFEGLSQKTILRCSIGAWSVLATTRTGKRSR